MTKNAPASLEIDHYLQRCIESLDLITGNALDQISSLADPHALVVLVVEAVGMILDVKPVRVLDRNDSSKKRYDYWGPMQRYLCDPDFVSELKYLEIQKVDKKIIAEVTEVYRNDEKFKPDEIASISNVAECLCRWVIGVVDSYNNNSRQVNDDELQKALTKGKKEWGRSKIMIVGEGRAGKSAFANSLIGKAFEKTSSTIGINELTCDVKHAAVSGDTGRWGVFKAPEKEYETALAKVISDTKNGRNHVSAPLGKTGFDVNNINDIISDGVNNSALSNPDLDINNTNFVTNGPAFPSTSIDDHSTPNIQQKSTLKSPKDDLQSDSANDDDSGGGNRNGGDTTSPSHPQGTPKKPSAKKDIDNDFVMKTLADKIYTESKFILSVYDFGGQEVFNVIHPFFLTQYGIYVVVFNMEWLISSDKTIVDNCMAYLTFWINSVVVHTTHTSRKGKPTTAPVAFVGTHKDLVPSPADHEKISVMLSQAFSGNIAFRHRIQYKDAIGTKGTTNFNFFPVDNTQSREDTAMLSLMKMIEEKLNDLEYVHDEKDLSWFQVLDSINETKRSFLPLSEVQEMAQKYNVPIDDVSVMLSFFHQVGVLMWHDEDRLKDIVIIDPVKYFVTPATIIICKHLATGDDATFHSTTIHSICEREYMDDWNYMTTKGIVSEELMRGLLEDYKEHYNQIVQLMMKYSLAIFLPGDNAATGGGGGGNNNDDSMNMSNTSIASANRYVIPALLPIVDINLETPLKIAFFFFFTASRLASGSNELLRSDLKKDGFLPSGLFERLIGRTLTWSQETYGYSEGFPLNKNQVTLFFGSQMFRLTELMEDNCIRVEVEGRSPKLVHTRLNDFLGSITKECLKSLYWSTLLPYKTEIGKGESESSSVMFVRLEAVTDIEKNCRALNLTRGGKRSILDVKEAKERYEPWMVNEKLLDKYDVFISYRWGQPDDDFVGQLFDRLTLHPVGNDEQRNICTFLDKIRFSAGVQFQNEFCQALTKSSIVAPIISPNSLKALVSHDPNKVDNMLVEWICALYCHKSKSSSIQTILPIAFGSVITNDDGTTTRTSLFNDPIRRELPVVMPIESLAKANELLIKAGIECHMEAIMNYTVKSIVEDLLIFILIKTWEVPVSRSVVDHSAKTIHRLIEESVVKTGGGGAVVGKAVPNSGDTAGSDPSTMTLDEMVKKIKSECSLEEKVPADIIKAAIKYMGLPEENFTALTLKQKAIRILKEFE